MAENWELHVTIKKKVDTIEAGEAQYNLLETRLAGYPDIEIKGYLTNCQRLPIGQE